MNKRLTALNDEIQKLNTENSKLLSFIQRIRKMGTDADKDLISSGNQIFKITDEENVISKGF